MPLTALDTPAAVAAALDREWLVACLCAEWCGTCRDYRPGFAALQAQFPQAAFLWIDIETHADWADDFDIEDFPTLLIQQGPATRFFGPMLPYHSHLTRSLQQLMTAEAARPDGISAPDLRDFLRGIAAG
ncbi:MAG: thioredoxin family protein [Rhodocyclaceae bacterium]|nr:thioredoxin family protein [Rhodocyclaceae bacterium]